MLYTLLYGASFDGYEFNLVDLPGTYSLSAYSPEELYVRKQLVDKTPDVVINVIDASNLERNLYLTTQLIDMHIRMVCALNMYDETEQRGRPYRCTEAFRALWNTDDTDGIHQWQGVYRNFSDR